MSDQFIIQVKLQDTRHSILNKDYKISIPLTHQTTPYDLGVGFRDGLFEVLGLPATQQVIQQVFNGVFLDLPVDDYPNMTPEESEELTIDEAEVDSVLAFQEKINTNPEFAAHMYHVFMDWLNSDEDSDE